MSKKQVTQPLGTALKDDDFERKKVLTVAYQPKVKYAWATGIAIGQFLKGLKAGEILGTKCEHCGRIVVPPRIFCEWCFKKTDSWIKLPDTGIVNTFSISYITADTTRVKTPIIPAVIGIDSTTNAGFLHLIGGVKPENVRIDMRVRAVWLEPSQRKGAITDIKYFTQLK